MRGLRIDCLLQASYVRFVGFNTLETSLLCTSLNFLSLVLRVVESKSRVDKDTDRCVCVRVSPIPRLDSVGPAGRHEQAARGLWLVLVIGLVEQ
jgi:hypothetical protein